MSETIAVEPEKAPVQTEVKPAATEPTADSLVLELKSGTKQVDDIPKELRSAVMEKLHAEPSVEDAPAIQDTAPVVKETPVEKPTTEEPSAAELTARRDAAKLEQKRLADEANTAEQKVKAAQARNEKAKKALEDASKTEVKLPDELLSEDNQSSLLKRLNAIEKRNEALEKILMEKDEEEIRVSESTHRSATEKLRFQEIDEVQDKFSSLKLDETFSEANAKYGAWLTEIEASSGLKEKNPDMRPEVLRTKAVELWNADAEFRKKIGNQPPKNLDRLQTLLIAHNKKAEVGGTVMGHLLEHFERTGTLSQMVQRVAQNSAADAASRTAKALKQDTISPIGPGDGASRGYASQDGTWTLAKAKSVIQQVNQKQSSGGRATAADKLQLQEALTYLTTAPA